MAGSIICASVVCPKCRHQFDWFRFYSLGEVAAIFQVTVHTVRGWINSGELPSRGWYLGRFKRLRQLITAGDLAIFADKHIPLLDEAATDKTNQVYRIRRDLQRRGQKAMIAKRRA